LRRIQNGGLSRQTEILFEAHLLRQQQCAESPLRSRPTGRSSYYSRRAGRRPATPASAPLPQPSARRQFPPVGQLDDRRDAYGRRGRRLGELEQLRARNERQNDRSQILASSSSSTTACATA